MSEPLPFDLEELIKWACKGASYYGLSNPTGEVYQSKESRDKWRAIAKALMAYDVLLKRDALATAMANTDHLSQASWALTQIRKNEFRTPDNKWHIEVTNITDKLGSSLELLASARGVAQKP